MRSLKIGLAVSDRCLGILGERSLFSFPQEWGNVVRFVVS